MDISMLDKKDSRRFRIQVAMILALGATLGSTVVWADADYDRCRALMSDLNGIYGWLSAQIQAAAAYTASVVANIK